MQGVMMDGGKKRGKGTFLLLLLLLAGGVRNSKRRHTIPHPGAQHQLLQPYTRAMPLPAHPSLLPSPSPAGLKRRSQRQEGVARVRQSVAA